MPTQALATFGVYNSPSQDEIEVLALANEYRQKLCDLHQEQHERLIDFRNHRFPSLWKAMCRKEDCSAKVYRMDKEIKQFHSEVRDRNAVTKQQRSELNQARKELKEAKEKLKEERKPWNALHKEYREIFTSSADWKNVKSLVKRRESYAYIEWPDHLREYAEIILNHDLAIRELGEEYQSLGLHSSIRSEIVDSSKPKFSRTAPGMRYRYGRPAQPQRWEKIIIQFGGGGLPWKRALEGTPAFSLIPIYANHKRSGDETTYRVYQQIGTRNKPRMSEYTVKMHRPMPDESVIQRWALKVSRNKRFAIPIISNVDFSKPNGSGLLTYDLRWSSVHDGVLVCTFLGDHVREELVLPKWLVRRRILLKKEQALCDESANELLERRGISRSKKPGEKHGVEALMEYCQGNSKDLAAGNVSDSLQSRVASARKRQSKAIRTIEKIYETVVYRVCRLHDRIAPDEIDLNRIKRYDTRDLLKPDVLGHTREILFAVAPGKLRELLEGYGLASVEVTEQWQGVTRDTDIFSTYVNSLAVSTGPKKPGECRRSHIEALPTDIK